MKDRYKIGNPFFFLSIILLIWNDCYLKAAFHNGLTGKLSDFAGLFALPFLLGTLWPKHSVKLHLFTGLAFIVWKSEYAQPLINTLHYLGITYGRTVDFSDNIALMSIPLSYLALRSPVYFKLKPSLQYIAIFVSCWAFMATSRVRGKDQQFVDINKVYAFAFSKRELVSRLNTVQLEYVKGRNVDFDSKTNVFHYHGNTDTLALMLDYERIKDQDTVIYRTSFAEIQILGTDTSSFLKLLSVYYYVPSYGKKQYKENAIKAFEQMVVKPIKKLNGF